MTPDRPIKQAALNFVGLTSEVREQFAQENRKDLLIALGKGKEIGARIHAGMASQDLVVPGVNLRFPKQEKVPDFPDVFLTYWKQFNEQRGEQAIPPTLPAEHINQFVEDVVTGFGEEAFKRARLAISSKRI